MNCHTIQKSLYPNFATFEMSFMNIVIRPYVALPIVLRRNVADPFLLTDVYCRQYST